MVEALNAFGPDCLHAYPSMAVLLADEKRAGRLRAAPAVITTSSELCTPEMAEAIEDAFGVRPLDLYASTEGLWGAACGEGEGHHLFEDLAIAENVDEDGRPVPDGERGARVLVTNLEQPRAAADPLRGLRRRHARPGAVPVRAHAAPDALGRRAAPTPCSGSPARRASASRCTRCSSA